VAGVGASPGADAPTGGGDRTPRTPPEQPPSTVRTFLIVDVRGYTRFTQEQGDEAAGHLAAAFAQRARETVSSCDGEVIELRGDEALCVFTSARRALWAAVELQSSFRQRIDGVSVFPLGIGIGLDAGEAVPIEGGYRGGALNVASRLCSLAGAGEILATETVVSLARRLEGIRFVGRRPVRLKGLEEPVRVIEVIPEADLPPVPERPSTTPHRGRRLAVVAGGSLVLVALLVGAVVLWRNGGRRFERIEPNALGVIDHGGVAAQVALPTPQSAVTAGGGYVWAASEDEGTLSRVDTRTHALQTLIVGKSAAGVAYGAGSVWVTNPQERVVAQIDPDALTIIQKFPVGNGARAIAVGDGAVWVANTLDATVSRIDLVRGRASKPIRVAADPEGIAVGADAVWVSGGVGGMLSRLDPASGRILAGVTVGNGPAGVAVGGGDVWVANREDGTVSEIDPAKNTEVARLPVGREPASIAVGGDSVWVANEGDDTITRLDRREGRWSDVTLPLGSSPHALTFAGGAVWASMRPSPTSRRGGVLRVESDPSVCRCIDPAFGVGEINDLTDQNVSTLAYDGLVAYRRVGGIAGGELVGDLAVRVPIPTDQGRTYTFQLRPGIQYSNGASVRASDLRHSLERVLTINPGFASGYYGAVVGAASCVVRKNALCDLSKGIETNDAAGTIAIHLARADPDFLHALALPLAAFVPAGTPVHPVRRRPIPGTGPYRVLPPKPAGTIRLVRNPRFHVWSQDARPDGYPDEIRIHQGSDIEKGIAAVQRGRADWVQVAGVPVERLRTLMSTSGGRFHVGPMPLTFWMFLNTRAPPFDDPRVRRAVNLAVDRTKVVMGLGGSALAAPTCQVLPPGFPGYEPYCPYTLAPNPGGTWIARDVTRARSLIDRSGTRGMHVTVVIYDLPQPLAEARYFVSLLRGLGYVSSLRLIEDYNRYLQYVADSRNEAQIGLTGWSAPILAPSTFFGGNFSCAGFVPESAANSNFSELCDRKLDAMMRRAAAAQTSDPSRANELWAAVDRAVVDRAAAVPLVNPRSRVLVSARVGDYQSHPLWGTLLDQLWVE
jgi:YVTN family beta-propeller protein